MVCMKGFDGAGGGETGCGEGIEGMKGFDGAGGGDTGCGAGMVCMKGFDGAGGGEKAGGMVLPESAAATVEQAIITPSVITFSNIIKLFIGVRRPFRK